VEASSFSKAKDLNLSQTWGHIHPFLLAREPQGYEIRQLCQNAMVINENATKVGLLLQIGPYVTFFNKSVTSY
jgi:hypothetical protein